MGLIGKSTTLKAILDMVCQKVGASMAEDEAHKAHIPVHIQYLDMANSYQWNF